MKKVTGAVVVDDPDTDMVDEAWRAPTSTTTARSPTRPDGCFRLMGPGPAMGRFQAGQGPWSDYLAGYSLELSPVDADVAWGRVDWDDDPFEDLTCDADAIMVSDLMTDSGQDICDMFEAEVDYAIGEGWTETRDAPNAVSNGQLQLVMWMATAEKSGAGTGKRFKTLWFDDDLDGKIDKNDRRPVGLLVGRPARCTTSTTTTPARMTPTSRRSGSLDRRTAIRLRETSERLTWSDEDDDATVDDEMTVEVEACDNVGRRQHRAPCAATVDSNDSSTADSIRADREAADELVTTATRRNASDHRQEDSSRRQCGQLRFGYR